jgi:hypothetical protein
VLKDVQVRLFESRGLKPFRHLALRSGIAVERDVMKWRGWHFRPEQILVFGVGELKESQGTIICEPKEAVTVYAFLAEKLVGLTPGCDER